MSTENLQKLQAAIAGDPALQAKIQTFAVLSQPEQVEQFVKLSQEIGAPVTADELLSAPSTGELSPEQLAAVSGGTGSEQPGMWTIMPEERPPSQGPDPFEVLVSDRGYGFDHPAR